MPKMRAVQVSRPKAPFEIVEREMPEPGPGSVRIKVQACGICHSDTLTRDGTLLLLQYPRVPGHEIVGDVDAVGSGTPRWAPGQRVGIGWHGGNCGYCDHCRRGEFFSWTVSLLTTGISFDGGVPGEMGLAPEAVALVANEISLVDVAPLVCARVTTFYIMRKSC